MLAQTAFESRLADTVHSDDALARQTAVFMFALILGFGNAQYRGPGALGSQPLPSLTSCPTRV